MAGERGARTETSPRGRGGQRTCRRRDSSPGGRRGPARRGGRSLTLRLHLLPPPRSGAPRAAASWAGRRAGLSGYKGGRRARGVGFLSLPLQLHRAMRRRERDKAPPKAAEAGAAPAAARARAALPSPARPRRPAGHGGTDRGGCRGTGCCPRRRGSGEKSTRPVWRFLTPGGGGLCRPRGRGGRDPPSRRLPAGRASGSGKGRSAPAEPSQERPVLAEPHPAPRQTGRARPGRKGRTGPRTPTRRREVLPFSVVKKYEASPEQSPEIPSRATDREASRGYGAATPAVAFEAKRGACGRGRVSQGRGWLPRPPSSPSCTCQSNSDTSPVVWSPQTTQPLPTCQEPTPSHKVFLKDAPCPPAVCLGQGAGLARRTAVGRGTMPSLLPQRLCRSQVEPCLFR